MSEAEVREAFREQGRFCRALDSPFTSFLCGVLAERMDSFRGSVEAMVLQWSGPPRGEHDAVPLRLCGGLHALVLSGADEALAKFWPPNDSERDADAFFASVSGAFRRHEAFFLEWMRSPPQTNEPSRSNGLFAGLCAIASRTGLPLEILELGTSGGLNLACDQYGYRFGGSRFGRADSELVLEPEWIGPPPPDAEVDVVSRGGCDRNPLDVSDERDWLRLRSYVWADQLDRLDRLERAASISRRTLKPGDVLRESADAWLPERLLRRASGCATVIFHSIAWQYFGGSARRICREAIESAGEACDSSNPVAWLSFERDGQLDGAPLRLRLWPGGEEETLGRMDFHGKWVRWGDACAGA